MLVYQPGEPIHYIGWVTVLTTIFPSRKGREVCYRACGTRVKLKHLERLWIEGDPTQPLTEPLRREAVATEIAASLTAPQVTLHLHVAVCLGTLVSWGREEVLEIGSEPCHCRGLTTMQILLSQSSQGKNQGDQISCMSSSEQIRIMAYFSNCTGWPSKATISAEELHYSRKRWNPPFLALVIWKLGTGYKGVRQSFSKIKAERFKPSHDWVICCGLKKASERNQKSCPLERPLPLHW